MGDRRDYVGLTLENRYRVESLLGVGGMASVYLARDLQLNERRVVIKVPDADQLSDAQFRRRFLAEIRSLASLDHPHIIKILGAGEHEQVPYAVVQFVGGGDLKARLAGNVEPPEVVAQWLNVVADALDFVHQNGFCHRDVKPANIFLDVAGHAYLSDFGIATAIVEADPTVTRPIDADLTMVGTFVGSPRYCPPEAIHRQLTPAYDQYSLATTVYEALTGSFPVEGQTSQAILLAKNATPARDIRELAPDLDPDAANAVMRALSKRPEDRFESCRAFAEAFGRGLGATRIIEVPRLPERRAASRFRASAIVAVALATVAAAVWWLAIRPGRGPTSPTVDPNAGPLVVESLHKYTAGSTAEEFERAMELCQRYQPDCDPSWFVSEEPRSTVLAPFRLGLREVTVGQFRDFVDEIGYRTTPEQQGYSYHRFVKVEDLTWRDPLDGGDSNDAGLDLPVVHVSQVDASAYCEYRGQRLPTEDEWEFTARGDDRRTFPWGSRWDEAAANWDGGDTDGLRSSNAFPRGAALTGHLNLAGNAAEWTSTALGGERVIKGGSWQDPNPANLRSAYRTLESASYSSSDLGFRCAIDPNPNPSGSGQ